MIPAALGRGGPVAGPLCLGGRDFGSRLDRRASHRLLDAAGDLGIDFLDLADVYPVPPSPATWGRSEEIVGDWLRGRRDRFTVATKVGGRTGPGPDDAGAGRVHLLAACDASLRRLRTDHVDLLYIHHPDPATRLEETVGALEELVVAGKARHVGLSNFDAAQVAAVLRLAPPRLREVLVAVQARYNLLHRAVELSLAPLCLAEGIGLLPWNPLATGMLTGKYSRAAVPPADSRFAEGAYGERYRHYYWSGGSFDVVEGLCQLAVEEGCSPAALALAWVLRRPAVAAAVIGASSPQQLEETATALTLTPGRETLDRLDSISAWALAQPA